MVAASWIDTAAPCARPQVEGRAHTGTGSKPVSSSIASLARAPQSPSSNNSRNTCAEIGVASSCPSRIPSARLRLS